jgi:hypothetical protein
MVNGQLYQSLPMTSCVGTGINTVANIWTMANLLNGMKIKLGSSC